MSPQSSIAHYKLGAKLGEGGMGAVYRATDTRLNREVAIKVLPEAFAQDAARMQRFEREAQVLASLNHPNIAAIYGIEQGAIVMELVEGADLRGPVPLETALDYARQIAAGLEAAHEKGIVHRDLKPANIKVTAEGVVKLLDFGLAKPAESAPASNSTQSPTLSLAMTQAGMILGTAPYMSPEQARGKPVDKRADIWAFGVILYELLAGGTLFGGGETVSDSLAAVITKQPDLSAVPDRVRPLLEACLEKDPRDRLRDIGDWQKLLAETPFISAAAPPPAARPWGQKLGWVAAATFALVAGLAWWRVMPEARPLLRMNVDFGADAVADPRSSFALSPDGRRIVYSSRQGPGEASLTVRELNQPAGTVLASTAGADLPFFSPDGQWIGFFADGKLKKMPITGAAPIVLADAPNARGGDWNEDGRIVFSPGSNTEVQVVNENEGTPQPLTRRAQGEAAHRWPQWLPGNQAVLYSANTTAVDWDSAQVEVWPLKTGRAKTLVYGGYYGRYLPGGYLVYVRGGTLFGIRFNPSRLETTGQPQVLIDNLAGSEQSGGGQFAFARNGLMVYLAGKGTTAKYPFGWMAAGGPVEPLNGAPPDAYTDPHLSPDGRQVAMTVAGVTIAIWDFQRESLAKLSQALENPWALCWAPDGRHILYGTRGATYKIVWRRSDGSGDPVTLLETAEPVAPHSVSPDGRFLAYTTGFIRQNRIAILPLDGADGDHPKAGVPETLPSSGGFEDYPEFSPDGRWIAYASSESGSLEVYVRPFRGSGKWLVGRGAHPQWSRAGRQLFFEAPDWQVMVVDYSAGSDAFLPGKPRRWSDSPVNPAGGRDNFDVAPDGKRIFAFPGGEAAHPGNLHAEFLLNFFDEVKRRLP